MEDELARSGSGTGRRDVLKSMLVLGAAAPLAGTLARTPAAAGQRRSAAPRTQVPAQLSSLQLAGRHLGPG